MDHGSMWREPSTTDGSWWEFGFSCPSRLGRTENSEKTKPARSEDPSLVIYTKGTVCCMSCRRRRTRDAACLRPMSGRRRLKCSSGSISMCVRISKTRTTLTGGWIDDPPDRRSISAHWRGKPCSDT